mgnify:CR=1 FL=1
MPCSIDEIIWFMQFDVSRYPHELGDESATSEFMKRTLADFPQEVRELVESPTTHPYYVWNTTDFELLPSFHLDNVVLLGDAAHLALPFTSAGVGNALLDAACLSSELISGKGFEDACKDFYKQRAPIVGGHVLTGRKIRESFMRGSAQGILIPLVD